LVPGEAQRIIERLGGSECQAYDILTACPSFALLTDYINSFIPEQLPEYVLCISTATLSAKVDYTNRSDSAIWGDGAAAWILSTKHQGKLRVLDTFFNTDSNRSHAVVTDTFGHFYQDGRAVRDFSVRQTVRLLKRLDERFDIDWNRDVFIGHQANRTMLEQITNNRKIPESSHWHNVTYLGNQAGAGAAAVLAQNWEKIRVGQKIVVAVLGAGLSWGSILFEAIDA
jgi:3-oxoacyl-[acyl-carrier-protein] synthase-3